MPRTSPLYTIGYEGKQLDELIAMLHSAGVELVIDIRELPLSRRRGFSKTPLGHALAAAGIDYMHMRHAGNPYRRDKDKLPRPRLLAKYARHLARTAEVVDDVAAAARGRPAALLCYEAAPGECHRSVLAPLVARKLQRVVRDL